MINQKPKESYPIDYVVKWYFGNYCTRKCFTKPDRLFECRNKLLELADKSKDLKITHKDFKELRF